MKSIFSRKTGCLVLALVLSGVYVCSFMPAQVRRFVVYRDNLPITNIFASDKYRFGDLYGISFLPAFRLPYHTQATRSDTTAVRPDKAYDLCILGDSYTGVARLQDSSFNCVNKLTLGSIDDVVKGNLPVPVSSPQSILVIETAERVVRSRFGIDTLVSASKPAFADNAGVNWMLSQIGRFIRGFCRDASTDLEYFIFDYGLVRPIKELRAAITYKWFNRIPEGVALSANGDHLYLKETVQGQKTSSFAQLDSAEVDTIVRNLNRLNQRAHQLGYSAVFLSIIPNPVSVIEPNRTDYNHLTERVERHPGLKMNVISLYSRFVVNGGSYYHPSDSHWNQAGVDVWVTTMNQLFNRTTSANAL